MKFLFYDVETANRKRNSICSVGWCLVEDMHILSSGCSLINPNVSFDPYCSRMHGISASDVSESPTFVQYWQSCLSDLMKDSVVVSHNASSMDICATEKTLSDAGIVDVIIDYFDFLPVSQHLLPELENHRLDSLAAWANVSFNHHSALDDAQALFEVSKMICLNKGYASLEEMFIRSRCALIRTEKTETLSSFQWIDEDDDENDAPVYEKPKRYDGPVDIKDDLMLGCIFCVTGDLPIARDDAERMILEHGGKFRDGVSTKTTFLVVGSFLDSGDSYMSRKHRKALELINQGLPLQILSSDQFMDMLNAPENHALIQPFRDAELKKKQAEQEKERIRQERVAAREAKKSSSSSSEKKKPSSPGVVQISLDGDIISEFDSVSSASSETGVNPKCIRDAAKGIQRTAGGFLWAFLPVSSE